MSLQKNLFLQVSDIEFEPDMNITKEQIGVYVHLDSKLIDVVVLGDTNSKLKIPLKESAQTLQFIVKSLGEADTFHGSISFPLKEYFLAMPNLSTSHWVTLFDDMNDDLYDGNLGENDEELPRIYCHFDLQD